MQYSMYKYNDAQHALNTHEIESIGLIFYIFNERIIIRWDSHTTY